MLTTAANIYFQLVTVTSVRQPHYKLVLHPLTIITTSNLQYVNFLSEQHPRFISTTFIVNQYSIQSLLVLNSYENITSSKVYQLSFNNVSIKICSIKPNDLPQPYLHLPIKGSCKGQAPSQSLAKDKKVKMKFQIVVLLCLAAALKADVSFSKQSVSSKPLMYFR